MIWRDVSKGEAPAEPQFVVGWLWSVALDRPHAVSKNRGLEDSIPAPHLEDGLPGRLFTWD